MEPSVVVKVRKSDVQTAKQVLKQAEQYFEKITGMTIMLRVDDQNFIQAWSMGGVWLYSASGRIMVNNSLESKLESVRHGWPQMRYKLFGTNPNRRHLD